MKFCGFHVTKYKQKRFYMSLKFTQSKLSFFFVSFLSSFFRVKPFCCFVKILVKFLLAKVCNNYITTKFYLLKDFALISYENWSEIVLCFASILSNFSLSMFILFALLWVLISIYKGITIFLSTKNIKETLYFPLSKFCG